MKKMVSMVTFLVFATLIISQFAIAGDLKDIISKNKLRVGICVDYEPIGFLNNENKTIGYDADVAQLMADSLEVDLELVVVNGSSRIPMVISNKVDVSLCTITATLARAKAVDFSNPYLRVGVKLLVQKDSTITSMDDLAGKTVVVGRGTTGENMVKTNAPEAKLIYTESSADPLILVRQGKADAYLEDSTTIDFFAKRYSDELKALPKSYSSDSICIAVRKGNSDLLRWMDLFASTFVTSGKYNEYYKKWFGGVPPTLNAIW